MYLDINVKLSGDVLSHLKIWSPQKDLPGIEHLMRLVDFYFAWHLSFYGF